MYNWYNWFFAAQNLTVSSSPTKADQTFVFRSEPYRATVSDEQAFSVAMHILARGKKKGCGSFDIVWRDDQATHIRVKCYDGRTWELENGPMLKINGEFVSY